MAGKSTAQSSIYSDQYSNGTSDKAVDGNPDQEFKNGHCSRTLKDNPSWRRVDLSRSRSLKFASLLGIRPRLTGQMLQGIKTTI